MQWLVLLTQFWITWLAIAVLMHRFAFAEQYWRAQNACRIGRGPIAWFKYAALTQTSGSFQKTFNHDISWPQKILCGAGSIALMLIAIWTFLLD